MLLPRAADPSASRTHALEAAHRLQIGLFVPLIVESEFPALDEARERFESIGCHLLVPPREIFGKTGDKLEFARFLTEIGVPGPLTRAYAPGMEIERFPVYLKPQRGSGSVGTARIESAHSLHEAAHGRNGLIVQDAVDGTEFTVDCFAAAPGRVVAAIPRERIAIKAGVSVKGRTYHHPPIERIVQNVVDTKRPARPGQRAGHAARGRRLLDHRDEPAFLRNPRTNHGGRHQLRDAAHRHGRRQSY